MQIKTLIASHKLAGLIWILALDIVVRMNLVGAVSVGDRSPVGRGVRGLGDVATTSVQEGHHEGPPDLRTTEAVNVEIEGEVK